MNLFCYVKYLNNIENLRGLFVLITGLFPNFVQHLVHE